ncbi:MAG TPA: nuclear transport factor 2 family protein [Candidatus Krumholzibacterium sp.]|nr:nuclear transport factor 2 family protein [Candidatus Krumholzibacterium sp.]
MRRSTVIFILLAIFFVHSCGKNGDVSSEISGMLDSQVSSWNAGDLEGYMRYYLGSEDLTFHSGKRLLRGWDTLDAMYRDKYSGEKRGILGFTDVEIAPLSPGAAYVIGGWQVQLSDTLLSGRFTLIVRKTGDGWRIVHDHSS